MNIESENIMMSFFCNIITFHTSTPYKRILTEETKRLLQTLRGNTLTLNLSISQIMYID